MPRQEFLAVWRSYIYIYIYLAAERSRLVIRESCVKVEVAVLGSPSLIVLMISVEIK